MRLKNGIVLDQDFILSPKDIEVQGEWITALTPWRDEEPGGWIDLSNKLVIPGLIDQHIHGCGGFDVEDASLEALAAMSEELARHGVTSFCPTVMARPIEELPPILDMIRAGQRQGLPGAYVHGARLEGPYLSPLKKGAQKESCLSKPDAGEFLALWNRYPGLIKIVDLAPELEGAEDFIRRVRSRCVISMAHTAASYEGALEAFRQGVGQATHLFNGMAALGHREPGPAGAVLDSEQVRAELICDGIHIRQCCGWRSGYWEVGRWLSAILCGPLVCPTENTPWEAKRFVCARAQLYYGMAPWRDPLRICIRSCEIC